MYDKFKQELKAALQKNGAPLDEIVQLAAGYDAEYEKLSKLGRSDFEIIVGFGDPEEIAAEISNPDDVLTDEERLMKNPLTSPDKQPAKRTAPAKKTEPGKKPASAKKKPAAKTVKGKGAKNPKTAGSAAKGKKAAAVAANSNKSAVAGQTDTAAEVKENAAAVVAAQPAEVIDGGAGACQNNVNDAGGLNNGLNTGGAEAGKKEVNKRNLPAVIALSVVAFAANAFILGLAAFIIVAAFPYLWRSFTNTDLNSVGAFTVTVIALTTAGLLIYCSVRMIKRAVRFLKGYLTSGADTSGG